MCKNGQIQALGGNAVLIQLIEGVYRLLWGDLLTLHLGNVTLSLSFMVITYFR